MIINYTNHRYHLNNVEDKPEKPQKAGIAGYWQCIGWLLAQINIAICISDKAGHSFYLNRKSSLKYINRHGGKLTEQTKAADIAQALWEIGTPKKADEPFIPPKPVKPPQVEPSITSIEPPKPPQPIIKNPEPIVKKEPEYPTKNANEEEIKTWCLEIDTIKLAEKFVDFIEDFKNQKILMQVIPKAFKRICQSNDIDDNSFLEMMKKLRALDPTQYYKSLVSDLTPQEWKRLVICWNDNQTSDLFKKLMATLEDPTFLFAWFPAARTYTPIIELFNLWEAKSPLFDKALDCYYKSPHYLANGTSSFKYFTADKREDNSIFFDYLIEHATDEQLLDFSLVHESHQSERLKERVREIPFKTLLSIFYKAQQDKVPNASSIKDKTMRLFLDIYKKDQSLQQDFLKGLDIEQSLALFYSFNKRSKEEIIEFFREKLDLLKEFLFKLATSIKAEQIPTIFPLFEKRVNIVEILTLYTAIDPKLRKEVIESCSKDYKSELFIALLSNNHYDLACEMLQWLQPDEIKKLVNYSHEFLKDDRLEGMLKQNSDIYIELLTNVFKEMKDFSNDQYFLDDKAIILVDQTPAGKLSILLQALNEGKAPLFHFEVALAAAKKKAEVVEIYHKLVHKFQNGNLNTILAAIIIKHIALRRDNFGFLFQILEAVAKDNKDLSNIFVDLVFLSINSQYYREIIIDLLPSISKEMLVKLIEWNSQLKHIYENVSGEKILRILNEKLSREELRILMSLFKNGEFLIHHIAMRDWKPAEFANLFSCLGSENYKAVAQSFFSMLTEQKADFFAACMKGYRDDKVEDFRVFITETQPWVKVLEPIIEQGTIKNTPKLLKVLRDYINEKANTYEDFKILASHPNLQ